MTKTNSMFITLQKKVCADKQEQMLKVKKNMTIFSTYGKKMTEKVNPELEMLCHIAEKVKSIDEVMACAYEGLTSKLSWEECQRVADCYFQSSQKRSIDLQESSALCIELEKFSNSFFIN
jgi:hypothetical protein